MFEVEGRRIAYRLRDGGQPTLVFLPGYASDMEGAKALALDGFGERRGVAMLRLDYSGTGSSQGRFEDGTLARWLEEVLNARSRSGFRPTPAGGPFHLDQNPLRHSVATRPDNERAVRTHGLYMRELAR